MEPTKPLAGRHFVGVLNRRWISNHALAPDAIPLPSDVKPWLIDGRLWFSDCFVEMRDVRPSWMPRGTGLPLRYLVHRIMAHVPFPDGKTRKAVYVLKAYGDPSATRILGRWFGGAPFERAKIRWNPEGHISVSVGSQIVYDASVRPGWRGAMTLEEADAEVLGMSFGSSNKRGWRVFPETHDPWTAEPWITETKTHEFLESHGVTSEAAHCIGMADVPHYFAKPIRVPDAVADSF